MARPEEFQELLFADVALLKGYAAARQVAAALLKYWDRRERSDTTLDEELAKIAGLTQEQLTEIHAEVDRMVAAAKGDAQLALTQRGGLAHELHTAVSRQDADASRHLTQLGAGIRVALRELPKDRYLDFMPVGEGGMGIVYWAMDTELGRQVAFKVVRPPMGGPGAGVTPPAPVRMRAPSGDTELGDAFEELKARFLQEAWVTGGMEHPGIVPVYELGRTEGGVPYYTMRFVRGRRTLETAIDELEDRPFEERLALLEPFLKICDAISYAHNRGVVHRDLKPANVALGEYGETIVLDWGLAKLSGHPDVHASRWQAQVQEFRDTTDMATMTSALGTPGYMAPEAATGDVERVDQLADVYSLGAILFEILTGRLPFQFKHFLEYARKVANEDAPAANTIDEAIPSALTALCASALARDRNLRPAAAADLAKAVRTWQKQSAQDREFEVLLAEAEGALADTEGMTVVSLLRQSERAITSCQRVLEHRPGDQHAARLLTRARELRDVSVRAREEQARKTLIRRVAISALVLLVVLGGVFTYMLEQRRQEAEDAREEARVERDNADLQRGRAEEAMGITGDLREMLEPEGRLSVMAAIGEKARAYFAQTPVEVDSPETFRQRMRALGQLGEVYLSQGDLVKARAVFDEAALASDAYAAKESTSVLALFENGRAHVNLARVEQAQGYPLKGKRRVEAIVRRFSGERPDEIDPIEWDEARVRALNAFSRALFDLPEYERSREMAEEALALARKLRDRKDAPRSHHRLAVETAMPTTLRLFYVGDSIGALKLAESALTDATTLRSAYPEDLTLRALVVEATRRLGWVLRYSEQMDKSVEVLGGVLPEIRELVALRPANSKWRGLLMKTLQLYGEARSGVEMAYQRAPEVFAEAYVLAEELHERDPTHAGWIRTLVNLCDRRAVAADRGERRDLAAVKEYRERASRYAKRLVALEPSNPKWRYTYAFTLTSVANLREDNAAALKLLEESKTHTSYALERIPTASDVNGHWLIITQMTVVRLPDVEARLERAAKAFDFQLRIAKDAPQAYWAQHGLVNMLRFLGHQLPKDGEPAVAQVTRHLDTAEAWLNEQSERGDDLDADIASSIPGWLKTIEALRKQMAD